MSTVRIPQGFILRSQTPWGILTLHRGRISFFNFFVLIFFGSFSRSRSRSIIVELFFKARVGAFFGITEALCSRRRISPTPRGSGNEVDPTPPKTPYSSTNPRIMNVDHIYDMSDSRPQLLIHNNSYILWMCYHIKLAGRFWQRPMNQTVSSRCQRETRVSSM